MLPDICPWPAFVWLLILLPGLWASVQLLLLPALLLLLLLLPLVVVVVATFVLISSSAVWCILSLLMAQLAVLYSMPSNFPGWLLLLCKLAPPGVLAPPPPELLWLLLWLLLPLRAGIWAWCTCDISEFESGTSSLQDSTSTVSISSCCLFSSSGSLPPTSRAYFLLQIGQELQNIFSMKYMSPYLRLRTLMRKRFWRLLRILWKVWWGREFRKKIEF